METIDDKFCSWKNTYNRHKEDTTFDKDDPKLPCVKCDGYNTECKKYLPYSTVKISREFLK